jgi:diguanylate cyclase (GGDEF)-like protein/PAS domain S-box-containing protein
MPTLHELPEWAGVVVPAIAGLASAAAIIRADETILYVNPAYLSKTKLRPEDVVSKRLQQVNDPDAYDIIHPNFQRGVLTQSAFSYGRTWISPSGTKVWVEFSYHPYLASAAANGKRELLGFLVIATEKYDLSRDESAAIERERLLTKLSDTAGSPIYYIDRYLVLRFINQPALNWIGKTANEVVGKPGSVGFSPDVIKFYEPLVRRALAGEKVEVEITSKARADGPRRIKITVLPDHRESGEITGVFISAIDIEEDYQRRLQLIARERQLQLFTDNIPEAVAYLDTSRRYKFVNNTFLNHRGKSREAVIGKNSYEVLGIEAATLATPHVERAFAGEKVIYERLVTLPDGDKRWFRIHTVPDFAENQEIQGIYVVGIDIHDVKLAQEQLAREKAELIEAMDSLPYPMATVDRNFRYQMVNRNLEHRMGKTRDQLLNRDMKELFPASRVDELIPIWERVLNGETISLERQLSFGTDVMSWMVVQYTPKRNTAGEIEGLYSVAIDVDALKRSEIELRHANWLLSSHFENTPLAVIEWDKDMRARRWSPQAEKVFGWTEADTVGKRIEEWRFVYEDDVEQVASVANRLRSISVPRATSLNRNYRKDGRVIWVEWYNSSLTNEAGEVVSVFSLAQDVTTRVIAEERLVHQATHDGLTGLPNRVMLQERLSQAISRARRSGLRLAALFIDLDRFKDVNDTLGHRIGDELLREMARRLQATIRESDFLVRLSGDEFMVIIEQINDLDAPHIVAVKLLHELQREANIEGHEIYIAGSIGISLFPDDAEDAETLLKNADMAMYRAKEAGKNTYRAFTKDMAEHGSNMRMLENSLRSAISRDEFVLYYQPKLDIATNRIVGAEALLRWRHPSRGMVMPNDFIHLAEETGLVHDIGLWVLDSAFEQLARWQDNGITGIKLAVNLAAGQFRASQLADRIQERITRYEIDAKNLEVEVTETSMLRDPDGVSHTLNALRAMGITIALDDFGTGYSSLSHLKRFPIDTLKIDKSFVADLLIDPDDRAIVSAVIALAHALDIDVVAEGVETNEQREMLQRMGCHTYQGFLYAKPLKADDFRALVLQDMKEKVQ